MSAGAEAEATQLVAYYPIRRLGLSTASSRIAGVRDTRSPVFADLIATSRPAAEPLTTVLPCGPDG
jgi:hypothetical protein